MTKEKWYNLTQIKFALFLQCVNTYTLFKIKHSKNNSYKKRYRNTDLHVCRVGVRRGHYAIDLIFKLYERYDYSDVRWKTIPRQCPTVAETVFQKICTGLGQR